jgi:transcriptional regulator with XRE-family HTH domain
MLDATTGGDSEHWRALLRDLREERSLTRAEVARLTGLSSSVIRAYESGSRTPSAKALNAIIDALGLPGERANVLRRGVGLSYDERALTRLARPAHAELVAELDQRPWPAFVANQSFEVVLSNRLFNAVLGVAPGAHTRSERSLLAHMSDAAFAGRLRNWDEMAMFMIGLAKGDPRWARDLEEPLSWIAPSLDRLTDGSPQLVARLVRLWDAAPGLKPASRFTYRVEWTAPDGEYLSFLGVAMLADIWDELHWNEWIPANGQTWAWFEQLPSR